MNASASASASASIPVEFSLKDYHQYDPVAPSSKTMLCHYCKIPLLATATTSGTTDYYRRPLYYNLQTCVYDFQQGKDKVWGHPACLCREMLQTKEASPNREMHNLHAYLRDTFRYHLPILASPPRELLPEFATNLGAHLTWAQYGEIIRGQQLWVNLEYEPFFVPHMKGYLSRNSSSSGSTTSSTKQKT